MADKYKKKCSASLSDKGNVNQNYSKNPFHPSQIGKQQMLVGLQGKSNLHTL
jgi:hypothetical protein